MVCQFRIGEIEYGIEAKLVRGAFRLRDGADPTCVIESDHLVADQVRGALPLVAVGNEPNDGRFVLLVSDGRREAAVRVNLLLSLVSAPQGLEPLNHEMLLRGGREIEPPSDIFVQSQGTEIWFLLLETSRGPVAIDFSLVDEVVPAADILPGTLVSSRARGYLRRRGSVVPVLSLNEDENANEVGPILVARSPIGDFAFPINRIHSLVSDSDLDHQHWKLTDPRELFHEEELRRVVEGYRNIYPDEQLEAAREMGQEGAYLQVRLGETLSVPLDRVQFVTMANLDSVEYDGHHVSIINGRRLYDLPEVPTTGDERVLIMRLEDRLYGVRVDAVEGIVRIDTATVRPCPRLLLRSYSIEFQTDVIDFFLAHDYSRQRQFFLKVSSFDRATGLLFQSEAGLKVSGQ